jgi:hypothetical protein
MVSRRSDRGIPHGDLVSVGYLSLHGCAGRIRETQNSIGVGCHGGGGASDHDLKAGIREWKTQFVDNPNRTLRMSTG